MASNVVKIPGFVAAITVGKKQLIVVPANWICDFFSHFEKFMANSLNRNQTFLCYYSFNEEALVGEDKVPNCDFQPNFNARVFEKMPFDDEEEGCLHINLLKYLCKLYSSTLIF